MHSHCYPLIFALTKGLCSCSGRISHAYNSADTFHSTDLLVLFSSQNRIFCRLGHTMGRADGVKFAAGERALQRGSSKCGPSWRHVLCLWHIPTASLLSSDLTHHPQLLIRSHISLLGWITERKRAWTLHFQTVNPLSLPPTPSSQAAFLDRLFLSAAEAHPSQA